MKYLHISGKVESRIENLARSGKAGKHLADKVSRIIRGLASGTVRHHGETIGSHTKYGEKRIKNCRKYDLGCGYRLITLQRGVKVFVPFLGTHDECQRWLENNSRLKSFTAGKGTWIRIGATCDAATRDDSDFTPLDECAEDDIHIEVSDSDLRHVFSGLVEGMAKRRKKLKTLL